MNTLKPGQRALVRSGIYAENLFVSRRGLPRRPITISNYPGERPQLRAAGGKEDSYPLEIYSAAYLRFHGFLIERSTGPSSANVYFEAGTHHVELSGCEIRDSSDQGVFAERTTHHLQILNNAIHDNGPSREHESHGIYLEGKHQLVANNLIYDNHYGFGLHIYPSGEYIFALNNTIVGNERGGIIVGAYAGTTVSYATIANNIVAFNGSAGIESDFPEGTIRGRGNIAFNNLGYSNSEGNFVGWEGGGIDYLGNNIVGDPRFRNKDAHDFRLAAGSAAANRASVRYSLPRDFAGHRRPQGPGYDIGAFERPP